jgi:predicted transcriptional regulator
VLNTAAVLQVQRQLKIAASYVFAPRVDVTPEIGDVDLIKGIPYYGSMNVTLTLDDDLIKKVRRIALERDTTLAGMVRDYLQQVAAEDTTFGRRRREQEALDRTFKRIRLSIGTRTWKRADLYARS